MRLGLSILARRLWPTLRRYMIRIGRWIIERICETSPIAIALYMQERATHLRRKAKSAKKRKRAKLRRARWWAGAARWIKRHSLDLGRLGGLARELCRAAQNAKIPLCSKLERC